MSSFGIGGTNAHVVLRSAPAAPEVDEAPDAAGGGLLTVSATNREGLQRAAAALADDIASAAARTARADLLVEQPDQGVWAPPAGHPRHRPQAGRRRLAAGGDRRVRAARRRRSGPRRRRPAGCSPGRAPSTRACRGRCPSSRAAYRNALADVDEAMTPHLGRSVRDAALRRGRRDPQHRARPAGDLRRSSTRSPGCSPRSASNPAWLIGHSVGEYAAAAHAGVFDLDDACRLIVARGRLMQALPAGGAMVAVRADRGRGRRGHRRRAAVALAAVNGPRDVVLSGAGPRLCDRVRERLASGGAATRPLAVTHALHSPLMEPAARRLAAPWRLELEPPSAHASRSTRPCVAGCSTSTSRWTPTTGSSRSCATVRFADAVVAALESEPTHLIEVGPRRILAPLVRRIGAEQAAAGPGSLPRLGAPPASSSHEVVAALYREGLDPMWDALYEPGQRVRRRLAPYEFSTAAPIVGAGERRPRRRSRACPARHGAGCNRAGRDRAGRERAG